jgi:capsular polysaccharide biosynthesis protein
MNFLFTTPSIEDLIRVLKAWRFWVLGAFFGALIGAALYYFFPPSYRAKATVNVDFNLEQAWPQDTDRQQFYYLERESRKLEEIAWSDEIMNELSSEFGISVEDLRANRLHLSQPAEAGWHFYADDDDPQAADSLASKWTESFVQKVQAEINDGDVNEFVRLEATQSTNLPVERSLPLSAYLFAGSMGLLTLGVFILLFTRTKDK